MRCGPGLGRRIRHTSLSKEELGRRIALLQKRCNPLGLADFYPRGNLRGDVKEWAPMRVTKSEETDQDRTVLDFQDARVGDSDFEDIGARYLRQAWLEGTAWESTFQSMCQTSEGI